MKPQTADFLEAAQEALAQAKQIDVLPIPAQAARLAYYAPPLNINEYLKLTVILAAAAP